MDETSDMAEILEQEFMKEIYESDNTALEAEMDEEFKDAKPRIVPKEEQLRVNGEYTEVSLALYESMNALDSNNYSEEEKKIKYEEKMELLAKLQQVSRRCRLMNREIHLAIREEMKQKRIKPRDFSNFDTKRFSLALLNLEPMSSDHKIRPFQKLLMQNVFEKFKLNKDI